MSTMPTIPMIAPDGTSGEIPVDRVQDAIQAGGKRAYSMLAPDGKTTGYIPEDKVDDAQKAGARFTNFSQNPKLEGTYNMWDTAGHRIGVPYSLVNSAHGEGYQFDTNTNKAGLTPELQFKKDQAADPQGPGFLKRFTNDVDEASQTTPYSADRGVLGNAEAAANNVGAGVIGATLGAVVHPIKTLKGMADMVSLPTQDGGRESLTGYTPPPATIPTWGQTGADLTATAAGLATADAATGVGVPKAADNVLQSSNAALDSAGNAVKSAVTGDVNAPIPGTDVTPAARYESMKSMGIQPNAAEATNSPVLKAVQKVNENSLTAASTYAKMRAQNLTALDNYTEHVLDSMSPLGTEEGGAVVQQGLLKSHADLKTAATEAFKDLDQQIGNQPLERANGLRQQAQEILDANGPYYKDHPELEPTKAMAIVRDLAGAKTQPKPGPVVIPGFGPTPPAPEVAAPRVPTYTELHRLRSDLLDFNNTNPDLVKNQANGWISQLAAAADHAITSSEGALTPDQVDTFRNANAAWKFMKDTYDNPSHPFYDAVRTTTPSKLVSGISQRPEIAKMLQGSLEPEEIGPIQRGVAEKLLATTKEGGYNFKTFQGRWNKLDPEYRDALFTPTQRQQLEDIGNAGSVLNTDLNPSGTAKLGQAILEGRGITNPLKLVDNLLYHPLQYFVARRMNSPTFVDWLMRGRGVSPTESAGWMGSPKAPGSFAEAQAMANGTTQSKSAEAGN